MNESPKHPDKTSSTLGIPGLRLVIAQKRGRNIKEVYIEASTLETGKAAKRFYCGTLNTVDHGRLTQGIHRAIESRKAAKEALLLRRQKEQLRALEHAKRRDLRKVSENPSIPQVMS